MRLKIETVLNGFIVSDSPHHGEFVGNQWVFENAAKLAVFIENWGRGIVQKQKEAEKQKAK